jgi:hypothetical protein
VYLSFDDKSKVSVNCATAKRCCTLVVEMASCNCPNKETDRNYAVTVHEFDHVVLSVGYKRNGIKLITEHGVIEIHGKDNHRDDYRDAKHCDIQSEFAFGGFSYYDGGYSILGLKGLKDMLGKRITKIGIRPDKWEMEGNEKTDRVAWDVWIHVGNNIGYYLVYQAATHDLDELTVQFHPVDYKSHPNDFSC